MKYRSALSAAAAAAAAIMAFAVNASAAAAAAPPGAVPISGTVAPAAKLTPQAGPVARSSTIDFEVQLRLASGAQAYATAVSTPGSALYRKFLTPAQWEQRFSPTAGQVAEVAAFLRKQASR